MSKRSFEILNVKCGGCANTLKSKLEPIFGEISVDLDTMPRVITLDIDDKDIKRLRVELRRLGYPMADENLGLIENQTAKAKSFISCAVGKFSDGS